MHLLTALADKIQKKCSPSLVHRTLMALMDGLLTEKAGCETSFKPTSDRFRKIIKALVKDLNKQLGSRKDGVAAPSVRGRCQLQTHRPHSQRPPDRPREVQQHQWLQNHSPDRGQTFLHLLHV
ncbi:uncharacterized protein V6R79_002940 [Siganus canaliculatus]